MNQPKISIITSSFNCNNTIHNCIESILAQTYNNYEYVIIDGGSIDGTVATISKYEKLFNGRLIWLSEKDSGIYDAWNKGIHIATGEWIMFVGGDDILLPDALQNYVNALSTCHSVNFISSKVILTNSDLQPIRTIGKKWSKQMLTYCSIAHVGSMHHRDLFRIKGSFCLNYKIAADYDFLLRNYDIISPYFIDKETAMMRTGGISNKSIFKVANEVLKIKLSHKTKSRILCLLDYYISIIKFYAMPYKK